MCTCMCNWVTMLYRRKKKLYWGNKYKKKRNKKKKLIKLQQSKQCGAGMRIDIYINEIKF